MASITVLLIIVVVIIALFLLLRGQRTRGPGRRQLRKEQGAGTSKGPSTAARAGGIDKLQANKMFWGVEMGQPGCEAAHELLGKQFPFDEAPGLPLEGCTSAVCTCQFKGLRERRSKFRRKRDDRRTEIRFEEGKSDRRAPKNRRRSDSWNDHNY